MARKKNLTTIEKIEECKQEIQNTEDNLSSLKNELKELYKVKEQEEKDFLYNAMLQSGLTVEQLIEKITPKVEHEKVEKKSKKKDKIEDREPVAEEITA